MTRRVGHCPRCRINVDGVLCPRCGQLPQPGARYTLRRARGRASRRRRAHVFDVQDVPTYPVRGIRLTDDGLDVGVL